MKNKGFAFFIYQTIFLDLSSLLSNMKFKKESKRYLIVGAYSIRPQKIL
jgi:hypothetical protein